MSPNLTRTLLALVSEGEAASVRLDPVGDAWLARVCSGGGGVVFSADEDMVRLVGRASTPREALDCLEAVCSRPEHLAALSAFDL